MCTFDMYEDVPCAQPTPMNDTMLGSVTDSFLAEAEQDMLKQYKPTPELLQKSQSHHTEAPPRLQKYIADLEATIQSGEVPVRSNLAQKMERELSDRDKQEYRQKSTKAKADFRLKWAKESLESC